MSLAMPLGQQFLHVVAQPQFPPGGIEIDRPTAARMLRHRIVEQTLASGVGERLSDALRARGNRLDVAGSLRPSPGIEPRQLRDELGAFTPLRVLEPPRQLPPGARSDSVERGRQVLLEERPPAFQPAWILLEELWRAGRALRHGRCDPGVGAGPANRARGS